MTESIPWRDVCKDAALRAAEEEALAAWQGVNWQLNGSEPIPFNHRWEHVQQVVKLALWLAAETGADVEIVEAAAWLHDVRKRERNHGARGAEAALAILPGTDYPPAKIGAVADAIRVHAGMTRKETDPMQPLEAAVLWDADKLSKIGVQSLVYVMSSHYVFGQTLSERRRSNQEFIETVLSETVKSMNTEPARRLAEERYRRNAEFMDVWRREEELTG